MLNRVHIVIEKIQLVVSRLFAGDNRLSPDILLVTTGCQQTKKSGDNRLSADLALFVSPYPTDPEKKPLLKKF